MSFEINYNGAYCRDKLRMCQSMQTTGKLQLSTDIVYDFTSEDLQDLGEIGRGGFGTVNKMIHRISNTVMAVKVRLNSHFCTSRPILFKLVKNLSKLFEFIF